MKRLTLPKALAVAAMNAGAFCSVAQYTIEQVPVTDKYTLYTRGNTLYSQGADALYYSADSGYNWNTWCSGIAALLGNDEGLSDAYVLNATTAVITVRSNTTDSTFIYKTTDTGQSWQRKYTAPLSQLAYSTRTLSGVTFSDAVNGWSYGKGVILKTSDGGESWQEQFTHYESPYNSDYITELFAFDGQNCWTSGYGAGILHTSDGGGAWEYQYANDTATAGNMADDPCYYIYGIHFSSPQHGVASAGHGAYLRTADGGQSWDQYYTSYPNDNVAPFCLNDSLIWLVGGDYCDNTGCYSGQSILYSTNGGLSWNALVAATTGPLGAYNDYRDVWFFDENLGYTTRGDGTLWRIRNEAAGLGETTVFSVTVSPNPATETVLVQLPADFGAGSLILASPNGAVVHASLAQEGTTAIDLTRLQAGIYMLTVRSGAGAVARQKIVKR